MTDPQRDFARAYLDKVALGEGCGCAEQVIRDARARPASGDSPAAVLAALRYRWRWTKAWLRAL